MDEKTLQTIGRLIHNQSEKNNLSVARGLEKQKSDELRTAGEILKTFAGAKRKIENNQLTVVNTRNKLIHFHALFFNPPVYQFALHHNI